jgi:hypothetical protein
MKNEKFINAENKGKLIDLEELIANTKDLNDLKMYNMEFVMEKFSTSRRTIHNWIKKGKLHPVKTGTKLNFIHEDIMNYINLSLNKDLKKESPHKTK